MEFLFGDTSRFMPHGHCYLWRPEVLWLNVISDALIACAYFTIPILLTVLLRNNPKITEKWVIGMFGLFILFCGFTHVVAIITIWKPFYYLEGIIKALTAALSVVTAILFAPIIHDFLRTRNEPKNKI